MTTVHPVHVYYDANGNVSEWIVSDDDGFSPSERPGMVRVSCLFSDYKALPQDLNIAGMAVPHALNKLCVASLTKADAVLGAKLQANIAAVDAQIAVNAKAASDAQAASLAVWNALPKATQDALIAADLAASAVVP